MAELPEGESPAGRGMAQTDPSAADRFQDADTRAMILEITGGIGQLTSLVARIDNRLGHDSRRLDDLAHRSDNISSQLTALVPKIDKVAGFVDHGVPHLATKTDIESLKGSIAERPTRRQSIEDILKFGGLIGVILAIFSFFSRAR